jgi:hypothetical protein
MNATIHRTTVAPKADGTTFVQLYISDAPVEAEVASIVVQITVSLPEYEGAILVAQAQREAMKAVQEVLTQQMAALAPGIQAISTLRPALKGA